MAGSEYTDFRTSTGYGFIEGLCGVNCRHSFSPYYPGVNTPRWTDEQLKEYKEKTYSFIGADGKKKTVGAYDASQIQRRLENAIRRGKRMAAVKEAAGLDASPEKIKLHATEKRLKEFLDDTGLRRQPFREMIAKK